MQSRLGKCLLYASVVLLSLFLLSALVEGPQQELSPLRMLEAMLLPRDVPLPRESGRQTPQEQAVLWEDNAILPHCGEPEHRALCCADANGRIIRTGRYESSVYQVFRQEVAGG